MSLLTALIVENGHILAGTYFIFLKNVLDQIWKAKIPNLYISEKNGKVVANKTNFRAFLEISYSKFKLKLYQRS